MIYMRDKDVGTFEEWCEERRQAESAKTQGSKRIYQGEASDLFFDIVSVCFDYTMVSIPIYWMSEEMKAAHPESGSLYGYDSIMLNRDYCVDRETTANTLFHELVHAYCDRKGIKDTDGDLHLKAFSEVCESHGGICEWSETGGYSIVRLSPETMHKINERSI